MRQLILDTETTGLSTEEGHRITEIGIIEVRDQIPTGNTFHKYINPERELDEASIRITGLTMEKLAGMPTFDQIVEEFLEFIDTDPIVAHNASFDVGFLNHELDLASRPPLENEIIDTLQIARKKFPGARASLDALCQRFEIDLSKRSLHGALLDAELLAEVYIELTGGRQGSLLGGEETASQTQTTVTAVPKTFREPRPNLGTATPDELATHQIFIEKMPQHFWGGAQKAEQATD